MLGPNKLPRTLRGVGGIKLIDMPGVIYPPEVLTGKGGWGRRRGHVFREAPEWGITSAGAAQILGCTASAARCTLSRHRVKCRKVLDADNIMRLYWHREQVEDLAKRRAPVVEAQPKKLISVQEALKILGVSRSSLHRYCSKGMLTEVKVRYSSSARGLRLKSYYIKSETIKLQRHLQAMRKKQEELSRMRANWQGKRQEER